MKILIIYQLAEKTERSTIYEHLYSFRKFNPGHQFHYVNVFKTIPSFLKKINYDAVILHYTYLAGDRFLADRTSWDLKTKSLEEISGYKIAIPQDEYDHTDRLCELFKKINLSVVYTCFNNDDDIKKAYPFEKSGVKKFFKVFTGYVDESKLQSLRGKILNFKDRPIDIGYRARMLPAYFGRHGQLKYQLVNLFNDAVKNRTLITDINNTNDTFGVENKQLVKHGDSWYSFLLSCKAFVGCEGGSSLLDFDGSIKEKIIAYTSIYPQATFDDIEENCFPDLDYNISCFALSPRHFEAAMTKTLQILVEGEYGGIFKPWIHYIPLKRDFSNIDQVLDTLVDYQQCQLIVDRAFEDIVLSGNYTYKRFVNEVIDELKYSLNEGNNINNDFLFELKTVIISLRNNYLLIKYLFRRSFYESRFFKALYPPYKNISNFFHNRDLEP